MHNPKNATSALAETIISVDPTYRKITIGYAPNSIYWEPSLTALLIYEGLVVGHIKGYVVHFCEQSGHQNLDLLTIARKAQKQLCHLTKQSVYLALKTQSPNSAQAS